MAESIKNVLALNGKVLDGPKPMGKDLIAVIQDPDGACMAIMQEN
jgi:predicted enzyme related to lactoylglutathione lyase